MVESRKQKIWRLHCAGMEPSAIDRRLELEPETARFEISDIWHRDKLTKGKYLEEIVTGRE